MTPSDLVELLRKEMAERAKKAALAYFEGESDRRSEFSEINPSL